MTDQLPPSWEPDPQKMGNWRAMFEPTRRDGPMAGSSGPSLATPMPAPAYDDGVTEHDAAIDSTEYRPWIVQRGRSRPAMMLHLRRFEPRSGLWQGWVMSYPSLQAVEYMGDKMISLDFGARQFVIEGEGLRELVQRIQEGSIVAVQEYAQSIWRHETRGPIISHVMMVRQMAEKSG